MKIIDLLKEFIKIVPNSEALQLPTTAGVFVIVRELSSDNCEYVYCAQSANIRDEAIKAAKNPIYQDPDNNLVRSIEYLVKEVESQEERIKIFKEINEICTYKNN